MPLFEYICKSCGYRFEALVLGSERPKCPKCHGADLEQALSAFAMGRESKSGGGGSRTITPGGCGSGGGGG